MAASRPEATPAPGDAILHPLALASIALLIANDHVLKSLWPGTVTGKLSDVAGLIFFPLLLVALWEARSRLRGARWRPDQRRLVIAIVLTGVAFVVVKTVTPAADAYRSILGLAQWPFASVVAVFEGRPLPSPAPVLFAMDATDLVALPSLLVSYVIGRRCTSRSQDRSGRPPWSAARTTAADPTTAIAAEARRPTIVTPIMVCCMSETKTKVREDQDTGANRRAGDEEQFESSNDPGQSKTATRYGRSDAYTQ
jgi:hypothetical protein